MALTLRTPLAAVLHTTKDHLAVLEEMDLRTVGDLLLYLPRSYEDLSNIQTIASAPLETKVSLRGVISKLKLVRTRSRKNLVQAVFTDHEGATAKVTWFNQPHVLRMLAEGEEVVLTGKLVESGYTLGIGSPQLEAVGRRPLVHAGRLVPVYPQHAVITTKWLREKMTLVREAVDQIPETLPAHVLHEESLMGRADAVRALHFPENAGDVQRALDRMAFEEMYALQREALERKREWQGTSNARLRTPMRVELIKAFFSSLRFTPTDSQRVAIYEILRDMEKDRPMSRLLEGDVGSGKTLVATAVMANALASGGQCALMVPTEVLAKQHARSVAKTLIDFHNRTRRTGSPPLPHMPRIALLTGSTTAAEAAECKRDLARGTVDIVIGTHALLEDNVAFRDVRLVIVDEQHRFGVAQRERLQEKGSPHFLAMTATPIPRTLALTAYGHHDLSVLIEKPGNRKPVHTKVVAPDDRKVVERFIDAEIRAGRQVFVICPLIRESESEEMGEVKNVEQEAERLQKAFPRRRIAVLHGKMLPKEKEDIMRAFRGRESDILVSTSVIEVGIDVPNATIILIEGAERFGLAQLHQFRGRVGRSDHQSHCFLFTTTPDQARSPRLRAMEKYQSGFQLAEIDLKLRGPGELFGFRQSGLGDLRFGGILNPELVVRARRAAERALGMAVPLG